MGLRGPAPTPTRLRVLRGNPGKRPLPKEPEGAALTSDQVKKQCPADIDGEVKEFWNYYADKFAPIKIIMATDLPMLAQLARASAELRDFQRRLDAAGPLFKSPNGYVGISPLYTLRDKARANEYRLLREFLGSPTARTNIQPVTTTKATDQWDDL